MKEYFEMISKTCTEEDIKDIEIKLLEIFKIYEDLKLVAFRRHTPYMHFCIHIPELLSEHRNLS